MKQSGRVDNISFVQTSKPVLMKKLSHCQRCLRYCSLHTLRSDKYYPVGVQQQLKDYPHKLHGICPLMSFTLSEIVPWGRSYDEYLAMFSLAPDDLQRNILGCSDGPAGFNAVLTADGNGGSVISVDPLYAFSAEEIQQRIAETSATVLEQARKNKEGFVWKDIASVEELGRIRMAAMEEFLRDFDRGKAEGRYVNASLPQLDFSDQTFDIALCSHFLFLYSEQLSEAFHLAAIKELCRVATEVRIFPLLELGSKKSRHLAPVIKQLQREGRRTEIRRTTYKFQKGGNEMLVISS